MDLEIQLLTDIIYICLSFGSEFTPTESMFDSKKSFVVSLCM